MVTCIAAEENTVLDTYTKLQRFTAIRFNSEIVFFEHIGIDKYSDPLSFSVAVEFQALSKNLAGFCNLLQPCMCSLFDGYFGTIPSAAQLLTELNHEINGEEIKDFYIKF